jgi:hypothetical protein
MTRLRSSAHAGLPKRHHHTGTWHAVWGCQTTNISTFVSWRSLETPFGSSVNPACAAPRAAYSNPAPCYLPRPFRSIAPGLRFAPEIEDANTTTGVISGNVFGNDQILCGNVASTQWVFTPQIYCPEWCPEIDE